MAVVCCLLLMQSPLCPVDDAALLRAFELADADYQDVLRQDFAGLEEGMSLFDQLPLLEDIIRTVSGGRVGLPAPLAAYMH